MSRKMMIFYGNEEIISNMITKGLVNTVFRNQILHDLKIDLINNVDYYVKGAGVKMETVGLMNKENNNFIIAGTLYNFHKDDPEMKNSFVLGEVHTAANSKDTGREFAELSNVLKQWAEEKQKIITYYGVPSSPVTSIIKKLWYFAGETGDMKDGEPIVAYKIGVE